MKHFSAKSLVFAFGFATASLNSAFALSAPESFADLVDEISPSVVNITTTAMITQGPGQMFPEDMQIPDIFRDLLQNNPNFQAQPREATALGSGFIIDAEGYVVTNNHVIDQAENIMVETYDGEQLKAELIGRDPKTDVALLKIESDTPFKATSFGDSDAMRVGDWVVAVGNPLGQGFSVSAGIVSQRNRSLEGAYDDYIQTDAAINRGNSGGPLFNLDGEVVGMNTAILSPDGGSIGIGFAMSSRVVSQVVTQLKEFGETRRGWLGVEIQNVNQEIADALGLNKAHGVIVGNVPEGPAADAGILQGDVILKFDGQDIDGVRELVRIVGNSEVGKTVQVEIYRQGEAENIVLDVTLGQLEQPDVVASNEVKPEKGTDLLGMALIPNTEENAQTYNIETPGGLLILEVKKDSPADQTALAPGDIIRTANRQTINSVEELNAIIDETRNTGRDSVLLVVERQGTSMFIAIPIDG